VQLNGTGLYTRAGQWVLSNTRVFSPTKVNEFRFGYNSLFNNISQELAGVNNVNEKLGTLIQVTDPNSWGIPDVNLTGSTLNRFGNDANGPFSIDNKVYQVVDDFSWIRGKHSFRFGGDYRYNQFLQVGNEFARGRFTFSGSFTGNANTLAGGYNGADFLLGSPTVIEAAVALARGDFRNNEIGFYFDDTFKATPHLTINWGLRYELAQPLLDKFGLQPTSSFARLCPPRPTSPIRTSTPCWFAPAAATSTTTCPSALPAPCSWRATAGSATASSTRTATTSRRAWALRTARRPNGRFAPASGSSIRRRIRTRSSI
jgi:hypothetical protein